MISSLPSFADQPNILEVNNLNVSLLPNHLKSLATLKILENINFSLKRGEIKIIIGESGAGKSTLLYAMAGMLSNQLILNGDIRFNPAFIPNFKLGFIFQDIGTIFNPLHKIKNQLGKEFIAANLDDAKLDQGKNKEKLKYFIQMLNLDQNYFFSKETAFRKQLNIFNKYPSQCSLGELQRLSILAVLMQNPNLIFIDEGSAFLDQANQKSLSNIIKKLSKEFNISFLLATHNLTFINYLQAEDQVYLLKNHKLTCLPKLQVENLRFKHEKREGDKINKSSILSLSSFNLILKTGGLFKKNKVTLLENLNFFLNKGDILAVKGPSGVGKSTLAKFLVRLDSDIIQHTGSIKIFGEDFISYCAHNNFRNTLQIILQNYSASLNPKYKIKSLLLEALNLQNKSMSRISKYKRLIQAMQEVNLNTKILKKFPYQLSQGEKQRVALAKVLMLRPQIIIMDEITSSLDQVNEDKIIRLLKEINQKYNITFLVITHSPNVINHLATKVLEL
ncbi:ABC transporter ATP binding subunit [Candidatus Hepatincolaceae symbiont of Richtersius coronifer]